MSEHDFFSKLNQKDFKVYLELKHARKANSGKKGG
jgi:hypothetical protein